MASHDSPRPLIVAIVGILYILVGIFFIAMGALVLAGMAMPEVTDQVPSELLSASGIGLIIIGLIPLVIGYGLFQGWKVMWYLGVIFAILEIIVLLLGIVGGAYGAIIPIIIDLIILWYLFRKNVKAFFGVN